MRHNGSGYSDAGRLDSCTTGFYKLTTAGFVPTTWPAVPTAYLSSFVGSVRPRNAGSSYQVLER